MCGTRTGCPATTVPAIQSSRRDRWQACLWILDECQARVVQKKLGRDRPELYACFPNTNDACSLTLFSVDPRTSDVTNARLNVSLANGVGPPTSNTSIFTKFR